MDSWQECETLGDRLKWVRENRLRLGSLREAERYFEAMPPDEAPGDVSWATVGRYERGERLPRVDYVLTMVEKGQVSVRWVMQGEGSPYDVEPTRAERIVEEIRRILKPLSGVEDSRHLVHLSDDDEPGRNTA